jgi:hypothetical protein
MALKNSVYIEIEERELGVSKEICGKANILTDDWDSPYNKENPRSWSACKQYAFMLRE